MNNINTLSFRKKLIFIQTATALIAIIICCVLFLVLGIAINKSATQRKMQSIAKVVGTSSEPLLLANNRAGDSLILHKLDQEGEILYAVTLDKNNNLFASYYRDGVPHQYTDFRERGYDDYGAASLFTGNTVLTKYKIFNGSKFVGTLLISSELTGLQRIIRSYLIIAAFVFIAGLISSLLISSVLQKAISGRLLSLVDETKNIAETRDYSIRVAEKDGDEIGILSKEFNALLEQIDEMKQSLKKANAELEQRVQQRTAELEVVNEELESFSYSVSHDLKAPLRAVNGFTEIFVKKYGDKVDEKGKMMAATIIANVKKMGLLIDDLLEFSRIGRKAVVMEPVDMNSIVEQILNDAKNDNKDRNIEINMQKLPVVNGDASLLIQVWTNLISNAFKYTRHKEKVKITIGYYKEKDDLVFFVKDNGAGFDMNYKEKLFKVFQRLHGPEEFEGTGLGLANVYRIITKHGGKVWADGKVDEGATFYFSLPASQAARTQDINFKITEHEQAKG